MLKLNEVEIEFQPFGSACFIFMVGNHDAVEERFNSFYHHGAIQNPDTLEWWTDTVAVFSATTELVKQAFVKAALFEILNNKDFQDIAEKNKRLGSQRAKINAMEAARKLGAQRFNSMSVVNWQKFGTYMPLHNINSADEREKDTGNFDDTIGAELSKDQRPDS